MAISRKGFILDMDRLAQGKYMDPLFPLNRSGAATGIDRNGLVYTVGDSIPRFAKASPTSSKLGLLAEPQRTNYVPGSQDFPSWWYRDYSYSSRAQGPDGVSNSAYRYTTNGTTDWLCQGAGCTTPAGSITGSLWIYVESTVTTNVYFLLQTPDYGQIPSYAIPANTWYRVTATYANAIAGSSYLRIVIPSAGNTKPTAIRLYGAQIENGEGASSLIDTTSSAITRPTDVYASLTNARAVLGLNNDRGTCIVDITPNSGSLTVPRPTNNCYLSLSVAGGTIWDPGLHIWNWAGSNGLIVGAGKTGRNDILDVTPVFMTLGNRYRIVVSWIGQVMQIAYNGNLSYSDLALNNALPNMDKVSISNNGAGGDNANAIIHDIRVFPFGVSGAVAKQLSSTVYNPL